jgi:hypothetical protein
MQLLRQQHKEISAVLLLLFPSMSC